MDHVKNRDRIMRQNLRLLIIGLWCGIFLAGIIGYVRYNEQTALWNNRARTALLQTLQENLMRYGSSVLFASEGVMNRETLWNAGFKEVKIETAFGKDTLQVPWKKYSSNIGQDEELQGLCTLLVLQDSLCMDSIFGQWKTKLSERGFRGQESLTVRCLDLNTETVTTDTLPAGSLLGDSIAYFTLGVACELELTGWVSLPWFRSLTPEDGGVWCLCLLAGMLPVWFGGKVCRLYRRYRAKEREAAVPECVPVSGQARHRELKDGTRLDPVGHTLQRNGKVVGITSQGALLLKSLLQAGEEPLLQQTLLESLWPDGSGTSQRLYTAVNRLNEALKQLSVYRVRNENGRCCLREESKEEE